MSQTTPDETSLIIETERLVLRRFAPEDAPAVRRLCDNWAVAGTLSRVPHPYSLEDAVSWIAGQADGFHEEKPFAVTCAGELVGSAGLRGAAETLELGYWFGEPYWGRGYATEAARALCAFAFDRLGAAQIVAGHYHGNAGSARVLAKCGFAVTGEDTEYSLARDADVAVTRMELGRDTFRALSREAAA